MNCIGTSKIFLHVEGVHKEFYVRRQALRENVFRKKRWCYSVKKKKKQECKCFVYRRVGTEEQLTQVGDKGKRIKLLNITKKNWQVI